MTLDKRTGEYSQVSMNTGETGRFDLSLDKLPKLDHLIRTDPTAAHTMHAACFVGFLLLSAGLANVDEILGDYGLVHELAHIREFGPAITENSATIESLAKLAAELSTRLEALR